MKSFLIGRKLWRVVTGNVIQPTQTEDTTHERFIELLEDWDSKNHQILTWFQNSCSPAIQIQLAPFDTAKEAWNFLATRFQTTGLAHYYQLWSTLHSIH